MTSPPDCAVIVGSGFSSQTGNRGGRKIETRFGAASAPVHDVEIGGRPVMSLARHGDDHSIPPHAINYRANLATLQGLGATSVIALNTVGVITTIRSPGQIAVPDQVLDYTWGREHTVYDGSDGIVEHIDFTQPFAPELRVRLLAAGDAAGLDCHDGGVYAATQGPRLETAAEVDRLERDGADFVGMTGMPEAAIAAELGLRYACLALVVNRAAGRGDRTIHEDVAASTRSARSVALRLLQQFFEQA